VKVTILCAFVLVLLGAACSDPVPAPESSPTRGTGAGAPSAPATLVPTVTATPVATPEFSAGPVPSSGQRIVFLRPLTSAYPPVGSIWVAGLDGTGSQRLTPEDVRAVFAGQSGSDLFYVSFDGELQRTLWRVRFEIGVPEPLTSFEARWRTEAFAAVDPGGTMAAYVDGDSLYLLDITSRSRRLLLQGNGAACEPTDEASTIGQCHVYRSIYWSPDSRFLAVQKVYYEGARMVLLPVDGQAPQPVELGRDEMDGAFFVSWNAGAHSLCTYGQYAAPSGLYVFSAPNWESRAFLTELEVEAPPEEGPAGRSISGCAWLLDWRLVVLTTSTGFPVSAEVAFIDLQTGETQPVATIGGLGRPWSHTLLPVPESDLVLVQYFEPEAGRADVAGQPLIIDTSDGSIYRVLEPGDWVMAVLAP
jgi:hypothetical protein